MVHIPDNHIRDMQNLIWEFLWNGKKYPIQKDICTLPRNMGGLGMVDIAALIKVKRILWLIKILKGGENKNWTALPMSYFRCLDNDFNIPLMALRVTDSKELLESKHIPLLYKECILYFQELCRKARVSDFPGNDVIWCNNKIKFNGATLAMKHWSKAGIIYIKDIVSNGNIDEVSIYQKLIHRSNYFFEIRKLKAAVPMEVLNIGSDNMEAHPGAFDINSILNMKFVIPGEGIRALSSLSSRDLYKIIILNNKASTNSRRYWNNKFPLENFNWDAWFCQNFTNKLMPRNCSDFNWKIFYGILNTEMRLKRMRLSDGTCKICHNAGENLDHLLSECKDVNYIWEYAETLIKRCFNNEFRMSKLYILTGYFWDCSWSYLVNVIITVCRWEIWKRRNLNRFEGKLISIEQCKLRILTNIKYHCKTLLGSKQATKYKADIKTILDNVV